MNIATAWGGLGVPGQRAVELAWEGFLKSGRGIGAVLTDASGKIREEGRNRIGEQDAPKGRLFGSWIAHAEIDVLGNLTPGRYEDWTLTTTLEPCVLCASAIAMSNVGQVNFLASDPLSQGVDRLPDIVSWLEKDWPISTGPDKSPIATFCTILALYPALHDKPQGVLVRSYEKFNPPLYELCGKLVADRWQPSPEAGLLQELEKMWELLDR